MKKTEIRIVGAGPAGLMAADVLSRAGCAVTIIDHHRQPARKFLLAGRGGLNLTHSEPLEKLLSRYGEARHWLEPAIKSFPPTAVQKWCEDLGLPTFIGSSGRIFPTCMKASPVLRAWMRRLAGQGVILQSGVEWQGFEDAPTILALGGASWPELGSTGSWIKTFTEAGIKITPLQASNVRQPVAWSEIFRSKFSGHPIKNVGIRIGKSTARGEVMITRDGIEGGAIYAVSNELRSSNTKTLVVDLKPDLSNEEVNNRLSRPRGKDSRSTYLRKIFHLTPPAISLMREAKAENPKHVEIKLTGQGDLHRAISTAGGVPKTEFNENFQLQKYPNTMVVGEMLDWDAPTGGYLLQACFATAHLAATRLRDRL